MIKRSAIIAMLLILCLTLCACGGNPSVFYQRAIDLFAKEDYEQAADAFDKLNGYAQSDQYAAYCRGLLLYNQQRYAEAVPFFEKTQGFMYGTDRFRYCTAYQLMENGDFAGAAQTFEKLSGFENAALLAAYCRGRQYVESGEMEKALYAFESAGETLDAADLLLDLNMQVYNHAIELKNNGNYAEAMRLFIALDDYLSSADQAVACKEMQREADYAEADARCDAGDYEGALLLFTSLGSYRDASQRAEELADKLQK